MTSIDFNQLYEKLQKIYAFGGLFGLKRCRENLAQILLRLKGSKSTCFLVSLSAFLILCDFWSLVSLSFITWFIGKDSESRPVAATR